MITDVPNTQYLHAMKSHHELKSPLKTLSYAKYYNEILVFPFCREDSQEKTDEKLSFKDKLNAFQKKDGTTEPSPQKPGPTPKKRPQSEAFKAFEGKGLPIMGMPMVNL
jgi:hypothetical protein